MDTEYRGPQAPGYLRDLLYRIGGLNVFGGENFRLVRAESRLTPSGGIWLDWLPGTPMKQRNRSKGYKPYRKVVDVRMVRRYGPVHGWVLERWVPAKAYGTRQRWYSPAIVGGTMLVVNDRGTLRYVPSQGEYPSRGEYEYTGFAFESHELFESTVIPAVQALIRNVEELPTNPQRRIAQRAAIAHAAAEAAEKADEEWGLEVVKSFQPAFDGAAFVGYGKKGPHSSQKILKKLGISSHHR